MATERLIDGPAGSLFVDDGGADRGRVPVLLAHSFGGSTAQWAPQLEYLRRSRRAVAFDLRGHGRSASPIDGDYAVAALAADIGAVLDALDLATVVLVGHGLGAKAALEYAGAHPDRVTGLVLAAAPARIPEDQARQMIAGLEADYERMSAAINGRLLDGARDEVRSLVTLESGRLARDDALRIIGASLTHDPLPALKRYGGPKLAVVTPATDTPSDVHHLVAGIPSEVLGGTSHWMQLDKPDQFNRIVDRFLAGLERSS